MKIFDTNFKELTAKSQLFLLDFIENKDSIACAIASNPDALLNEKLFFFIRFVIITIIRSYYPLTENFFINKLLHLLLLQHLILQSWVSQLI